MSTHITIIGHNQLPQQLLNIATSMIDVSTSSVECLSIPANITADQLGEYADKVAKIINLHAQNQILFLCDLYGATPYNLIKIFRDKPNIKLITGLNLSMLITAIQNSNEPLKRLVDKVFTTGTHNIIIE